LNPNGERNEKKMQKIEARAAREVEQKMSGKEFGRRKSWPKRDALIGISAKEVMLHE